MAQLSRGMLILVADLMYPLLLVDSLLQSLRLRAFSQIAEKSLDSHE